MSKLPGCLDMLDIPREDRRIYLMIIQLRFNVCSPNSQRVQSAISLHDITASDCLVRRSSQGLENDIVRLIAIFDSD